MTSVNTELASRRAATVEKKQTSMRSRWVSGQAIIYIILVLGVVVSLFPYFLALLTSLKPANQLFSSSAWSLPQPVTLQNYIDVVTQYHYLTYILHTLIFAVIVTIGQLIFSTFAAYAFARMHFRDLISLKDAARPDATRYARAWVATIRHAEHPDFQGWREASATAFGRVTVRLPTWTFSNWIS